MEVFARLKVNDIVTGNLMEQVSAVISCDDCKTVDEFERHYYNDVKEYLEGKLRYTDDNDTELISRLDIIDLEETDDEDELAIYFARVGKRLYDDEDTDDCIEYEG